MPKGRLNTPEAQQLRGIRKEKAKRVVNIVKGGLIGGAVGTVAGTVAGGIGSGMAKGSEESKARGRKIAGISGGALGAQAGAGLGSYKNTPRTPAQRKSERVQVKNLRKVVRGQRKSQ